MKWWTLFILSILLCFPLRFHPFSEWISHRSIRSIGSISNVSIENENNWISAAALLFWCDQNKISCSTKRKPKENSLSQRATTKKKVKSTSSGIFPIFFFCYSPRLRHTEKAAHGNIASIARPLLYHELWRAQNDWKWSEDIKCAHQRKHRHKKLRIDRSIDWVPYLLGNAAVCKRCYKHT